MDYKELFKEGLTLEQFEEVAEKIVQSSGDKVRTEYSQKIKDLENKVPKTKTDAEVEFEERLKALEGKENDYKLKDTLNELGLPSELSSYLKGAEGLEQFKDVLNQHVLNGSFKPNNGHKSTETTVTKEQFKDMGYKQREQLAESQPEVYKALSQQ